MPHLKPQLEAYKRHATAYQSGVLRLAALIEEIQK
jgi:hypothetical protein